MAQVTLKGNPIHTIANLPAVGSKAPDFQLTAVDLSTLQLSSFKGSKVLLNIYPSIDTPTCANSTRKFNEKVNELPNTKVLCVSADLPFAQKRFCAAEGLTQISTASTFRSSAFGQDYGVTLVDGPLHGLLARAVVYIDEEGTVIYTELVSEIANEPNYEAVIASVK
jgi:thiol peroxidase